MALGAAAVAIVGVVGASGYRTGAQAAVDPIVVDIVSLDADGVAQEIPAGVVAALSDTGAVIAYDTVETVSDDLSTDGSTGRSTDVGAGARVWVRDRIGDTARPVAELGSVAPGISSNGCLVAYSVIDAGASTATLTTVDRCDAARDVPLPIGTAIDTVELPDDTEVPVDTTDESTAQELDPVAEQPKPPRVGTPALSFDGSVIVWSTGREIRRYERPAPGEPFVQMQTFDVSTTATPEIVTGAHVDVSADGGTVVYSAGPGAQSFVPSPANVYAWQQSSPVTEPELLSSTTAGETGGADSTMPTISGDGSFVVFESSGADLAAVGGEDVETPFVVGVERAANTAQILVADATRPALSADGLNVVYQRGEAIRVLTSTDDAPTDTDPTDTDSTDTDSADSGADELAAARPTGAVAISQHGRWLVFASDVDLRAEPADPPLDADALWAADRVSSDPDVPDTTTTTTTTTTTASTTTTTATTTTATTTSSTTPPSTGTTSTTTSTTTTSSAPGATTSTNPTTTTTVANDATTSTVPAPATPVILERFPTTPFPRVVIPARPLPRPTPAVRTSSTTRTPTPPELDPLAVPVVFEPTVINAGRRVQSATLSNASPRTIVVAGVSVAPGGPYTVVADGCTGLSLASSTTCVVDLQFAPTDVGPSTSSISFALADGSTVTTTIDGEGRPEPTVDLVPAVAGAGQTVTVFGAGFPAGAAIELTQPGDALVHPVVVDPDGTFAHVIVVLPNTPTGPGTLAVAGQPDVFADVTAELLVSSRGATSDGAALRGSVGNPTRR